MLIISVPINSSYAEQEGELEVFIQLQNGLRASPSGTTAVVYQDSPEEPFKMVEVTQNPFFITLPLEHKYKIEIYVDSIFTVHGIVNMEKGKQNIELTSSGDGGLQFIVFHDDRETPVVGATIDVYSFDGNPLTHTTTYSNGESSRIWLPVTILSTDYFYADINITPNITERIKHITINKGSQQLRVVTDWPATVNKLLKVNVFETPNSKFTDTKSYFVEMVDMKGNVVNESALFPLSQAYFSNFKVNDYTLVLKKKVGSTAEEVVRMDVSLTGKQDSVDLIQNNTITAETPTSVWSYSTKPSSEFPSSEQLIPSDETIPTDETILSEEVLLEETEFGCMCVAFRFSNVQDFYLNEVQTSLINLFDSKNAELTIAMTGDNIGEDSKIVDVVKDKLSKKKVALANRGWDLVDFTELSEQEQYDNIKNTNEKFVEVFGQNSTVFIAPYNKFNDSTIRAIQANGVAYLSSNIGNDPPPHNFQNNVPFHVPYTISIKDLISSDEKANVNNQLQIIYESLDEYGYAVINFQSQNFAQQEDAYINLADLKKLSELNSLIDTLQNRGIEIVTLEKIPDLVSPKDSPAWVDEIYLMYEQGKISHDDLLEAVDYLMEIKIIKFA